MKVPFALPDITDFEIEAVSRVLRSRWLASGQEMQDFEREIGQYCRARHALALNSATAGLHLMMQVLGVGPGAKVIVPTLTFCATANVVRHCGADVVLADVSSDTLCVGVEQLEAVWTPDCVGVIPVSFAGHPLDIDAICVWAKAKGMWVVEDAAHFFGGHHKGGWSAGEHPGLDATVFSFYATKNITTAEGGAIVSQHDRHLQRLKVLRLHGMSRDAFDRYTNVQAGWEYDVLEAGWKYNMPDVLAALGRIQLARADQMLDRRRQIYLHYQDALGGFAPELSPGHAAHLYPCWSFNDRNQVINRLQAKGVGCSVHFKPLHNTVAYNDDPIKYPAAEKYWRSCVSLPLYSAMTEEQIQHVIRSVAPEIVCGIG